MERMRQPAPRPGQEAVAPAAIQGAVELCEEWEVGAAPWLEEKLNQRVAAGLKKYGTLLQTHNGRDALQDAWEEAADLVMYLAQAELEGADGPKFTDAYCCARCVLVYLSRILWARGEPAIPGGPVIAVTTPGPGERDVLQEMLKRERPDRWDGWRGASEAE